MEPVLLLTIFVSFFCTSLTIPFWIRKAKQIGLVWDDMNKKDKKKKVAGSGGIVVVLGAIIGIFLYVAINTFYFERDISNLEIFSIITTMLLVAGVGLIDDLFGWKKGGLSAKTRIILVLFAAIPLMVINAGESTMLGIDFGIFYPLILVPLGVIGATTTFNFLAGYNGLEAGQGILILSALALVTHLTGNSWLSIVLLCVVAALVAFYLFNMDPAKVFPGDVLTYSIGALIATTAIIGQVEKIAIFFFIPYLFETGLKIRAKLNAHNFGVPNEDGSLELRYDKIYSLTHLSHFILKKFKKKVYEKDIVYMINGFQLIVIILGFWIFL